MKIHVDTAQLRPESGHGFAPDGDALPWRFDRRAGTVQGPLEMASFRGRALRLTLEPGQVGLLVADGDIRISYASGDHLLQVGTTPGEIDPSARLVMLDTERPLSVRWGETPDWRELGEADGTRPRGTAGIAITDPARFYAAFLRYAETCDEPFLRRLIGTLVQSRIGMLLAPGGTGRRATSEPRNPATLCERLSMLTPSDLNPSLEMYGIACTALACDPAPQGSSAPNGSRRSADELVTV
jgi:hypothetical protein